MGSYFPAVFGGHTLTVHPEGRELLMSMGSLHLSHISRGLPDLTACLPFPSLPSCLPELLASLLPFLTGKPSSLEGFLPNEHRTTSVNQWSLGRHVCGKALAFPHLSPSRKVSLECSIFICVVNSIRRMRLEHPASRATHPQSPGRVRCSKCAGRRRAGQGPSTQQHAKGSEMTLSGYTS